MDLTAEQEAIKDCLIEKLLQNNISAKELSDLCTLVDAEDLSCIIQHIYDLNEKSILEIAMLDGILKKLDAIKNNRRNKAFEKKIKAGFRDELFPRRKIVLAEGDSWFNYPIILTDAIDAVSMDPDLAVYSLAEGGDWLLNMLTGRKYVEELSVLHPDFFLISAGGNDIVGARRLAAIVQPKYDPVEFHKNEWALRLIDRVKTELKAGKLRTPFNEEDFNKGIGYLSKDFYSLLMFFFLQYFTLINGLLNGGRTGQSKFPGIKVITQGYDFVIPSLHKGFGLDITKWYKPFVRLFLGHGGWLKTPLLIRGILNAEAQRCTLYAMIYLFNEMMIDIGYCFNQQERRVFHIDSRYSVGKDGWTDELHALPKHFLNTGRVFSYCMHRHNEPRAATFDHVFLVTDILKKL